MFTQQLTAWYSTQLGKMVTQAEKAQLQQILEHLFGFHLVQFGAQEQLDWLELSPISHRFCYLPTLPNQEAINPSCAGQFVIGDNTNLPFAADSVDVVILPHTLEAYAKPDNLLSEMSRIILPEGHLVIMGFNPYSSFGLRKYCSLKRKSDSFPWQNRFYTPGRVERLLHEQCFEIKTLKQFFYKLPSQSQTLQDRFSCFEKLGMQLWPILGGLYIIVAKKKISAVKPLKMHWSRRFTRVRSRLAEPTTRGYSCKK